MAHRSFGKQTTDEPKREPITFDLGPETDLLCRDYANGALLIEMIGKVESGSVAHQAEGITQIFQAVVETDDGEEPEAWTGRIYDADRPLKNHTRAELDAMAERNREIREENEATRLRNEGKDEEDQQEELPYVQPGVDPTSSLGRILRVIRDPRIRIEMEELAEVVTWLVEQYTNRPTKSSSGSRPGGIGTGRSSRAARRSRGGTPAPVTSVS